MSGDDLNSTVGKGPRFIEIVGGGAQLSDLTSALLLSTSSINRDNSFKKYLRIFEIDNLIENLV